MVAASTLGAAASPVLAGAAAGAQAARKARPVKPALARKKSRRERPSIFDGIGEFPPLLIEEHANWKTNYETGGRSQSSLSLPSGELPWQPTHPGRAQARVGDATQIQPAPDRQR
jgi:hypothetical protein